MIFYVKVADNQNCLSHQAEDRPFHPTHHATCKATSQIRPERSGQTS